MDFAIIAAGEGSRLMAEGIKTPKPLIRINGLTLIDRLIGIFTRNDADSISIIVNEQNEDTVKHLSNRTFNLPFHLTVRTTPGSMYSLYALQPFLKGKDFCLTTVDTIFFENEFEKYLETFRNDPSIDGLMGVTDFVDDEKPLFLDTDKDLNIIDFYDTPPVNYTYVSGGIYCLRPKTLDLLGNVIENGMTRMRDFQRSMVDYGMKLKAYPFSKIIDIDHASDIEKAEQMLKKQQ